MLVIFKKIKHESFTKAYKVLKKFSNVKMGNNTDTNSLKLNLR